MDASQRALARLAACGIPAHRPGVRTGPCRTPYVVVRGGGSYALGRGARAGLVTLYCYVPRGSDGLSALAERVRAAMRPLSGQLVPTGNEGPETLEPDFDARSLSIEYRAMLPPDMPER